MNNDSRQDSMQFEDIEATSEEIKSIYRTVIAVVLLFTSVLGCVVYGILNWLF